MRKAISKSGVSSAGQKESSSREKNNKQTGKTSVIELDKNQYHVD